MLLRRAKIRSHRLALSERRGSRSDKPSRATYRVDSTLGLDVIIAGPGRPCHLFRVRRPILLLPAQYPIRCGVVNATGCIGDRHQGLRSGERHDAAAPRGITAFGIGHSDPPVDAVNLRIFRVHRISPESRAKLPPAGRIC